MGLRTDPTRTTLLRRSFTAEIRRRFGAVKTAVWQQVVTDDAFALEDPGTMVFHAKKEWQFRTSDEKVGAFRKWLERLVDEKVLTTDAISGKPWTGKYVDSAYKKGLFRAFVDARGKEIKTSHAFFEGTKEQFLRSAFANKERLSKVQLLATRAFEDLKGITQAMATQLNRILANGLLQGLSPRTIARAMFRDIDGLTRSRAATIARTEIVHAHAEGQLDGFEDLGEDQVGVLAEWLTAGDDKVCPQCSALEGKLFTIEEARGLIPRHPNCRCAWIPAAGVKQKDRRRKTRRAVARSIKAEGKKSRWSGKRLK